MRRIVLMWSVLYLSSCVAECDVPARRDTSFNENATLFFAKAAADPDAGAVEASIGALSTTINLQDLSLFGGTDLIYDAQNSRVYVVGTSSEFIGSSQLLPVIVAYDQQGTPDAAFNPQGNLYEVQQAPNSDEFNPGSAGILFAAQGGPSGPWATLGDQRGRTVALDSNQKVGIGASTIANSVGQMAFVLFLPNGSPDPDFGPGFSLDLIQGGLFTNVRTATGSIVAVLGGISTDDNNYRDADFDGNDRPLLVADTRRNLDGTGGRKIYLIRLTPTGALDTSLNPNQLITNINTGETTAAVTFTPGVSVVVGNPIDNLVLLAQAVRGNGTNIFVGGANFNSISNARFALIYKLKEDGSLDQSFNLAANTFNFDGSSPIAGLTVASGAFLLNINENADIRDLKVLNDGSVIAVGDFAGLNANITGLPNVGQRNSFVLKLDSEGAFATDFNASGAVLTLTGITAQGVSTPGLLLFGNGDQNDPTNIRAKSVCCDSDGRVIVISDLDDGVGFLVLSLNSDGTQDTAFNPSRIVQTYAGNIPNVSYQVVEIPEQSPAFGINQVAFVGDQATPNYRGCSVDEDNSIFIGGPGTDELLLAFKLCGGEAPTGPIVTCPAEPGSFICALFNKYSGLCADNGNGNENGSSNNNGNGSPVTSD